MFREPVRHVEANGWLKSGIRRHVPRKLSPHYWVGSTNSIHALDAKFSPQYLGKSKSIRPSEVCPILNRPVSVPNGFLFLAWKPYVVFCCCSPLSSRFDLLWDAFLLSTFVKSDYLGFFSLPVSSNQFSHRPALINKAFTPIVNGVLHCLALILTDYCFATRVLIYTVISSHQINVMK